MIYSISYIFMNISYFFVNLSYAQCCCYFIIFLFYVYLHKASRKKLKEITSGKNLWGLVLGREKIVHGNILLHAICHFLRWKNIWETIKSVLKMILVDFSVENQGEDLEIGLK